METKKVNITLTEEQYKLLLKGLSEAEASVDRQIEEIIIAGAKSPSLEKYSCAFFKLRREIISQKLEQQ